MQLIYYTAYKLHKTIKQRLAKKLPCKVISIGNITTGGTGKTPTVISLAEEATGRDFFPIILTRGYKGKGKTPCVVNAHKSSNLDKITTCKNAFDCGDEPFLMAYRLKDIPIIKCPDRYRGGLFALNNLDYLYEGKDFVKEKVIFIMDDGFQHWSLKRDLDIVLIDGSNPFGNGSLLPFGPLREPLKELKRANIIVITKRYDKKLKDLIRVYNQSSPIFHGYIKPTRLVDQCGELLTLDEIKGKRLMIFSGLANNQGFLETLRGLAPQEVFTKFFRDHHLYKQSDLQLIYQEASKFKADFIITTEKDMVKIKDLIIHFRIYALQVNMEIDMGFFDKVFDMLID